MQNPDIEKQFYELIKRDKSRFIKDFMINWEYMDKAQRRKLALKEGQPEDFFEYKGKEDLIKWFNWLLLDTPNYFGNKFTHDLIQTSLETDKGIFNKLGLSYDFSMYDKNIGLDNAIDFFAPKLYPVPDRYQIKTIVDFGAGFGRQANLWSRPEEKNTYIAIDAIAKSYCLQNLYFSQLGRPFNDYINDPANFSLDLNQPGINHIPTWRFDLIPDNSVDLVIAIQVLPELSSALVTYVIKQCSRILKPGGMFYIRDHKTKWIPAGRVSKEKLLEKNNFVKEFEGYVALDIDLHGIPRIWRKKDPLVEDTHKRKTNEFLWQVLTDLDTMAGGRLNKLNQKLKIKKF